MAKLKANRICMILPSAFAPIGGAETLAYELVNSLTKKGKKVTVVCVPSSRSSPQASAEKETLHIYPLLHQRAGKVGLVKNLIRFFFSAVMLKERFDVVHAHYVFPSATLGLVGKLFGVPVVATSHGEDIQKDEKIGYGMRIDEVTSLIIGLTLRLVDIHVVVSKSMIRDAIDAGSTPSKVRVVYNGIPLDKIGLHHKTSIVRRLGISKADLVVLYLGRLHPKKSPEDLVRAFVKISKEAPNAKLVIAGKGEEESKLKKLVFDLGVSKRVIFTGFVSENEKWDLLERCGIFVLPSTVEAFGIAVIEAMACGKPVITTKVGAFPEIIRDRETGLLVPIHSPDRLAEAIIELALDSEKRRVMGARAKRDVSERFEIERVTDEYLKVYEEVISKRYENIPQKES